MASGETVSAYTGVMNSLLGKLSALVGGAWPIKRKYKKHLLFLQKELSCINIAMEKYAMVAEEANVDVEDWASKVREVAYDLEDHVDAIMVHMVKTTEADQIWHDFAAMMRGLKKRLPELSKMGHRARNYNARHSKTVKIDPQIMGIYEASSTAVVALDGPMDKIIRWLMAGDNISGSWRQLKVVSIAGHGGLGKTTLAKQVYQKIHGEFDCTAFVSVSQSPDMKKILGDMLRQLIEDFSEDYYCFEEESKLIKKVLKGTRFLIVIDDIWSPEVWGRVKLCLPKNQKGSRIIVTTRNLDVAKACCRETGGCIHEMHPLNAIDSRRLFLRRIFNSDDVCPHHLKKITEAIVKRCRGLPLAINSIASLLASKPGRAETWEQVYRSIGSAIGSPGVNGILSLGFHDLPHHLKTCLLYLSIFPEDYTIDSEQLIWRWIAEGFIPRRHGYTLEAEGKNYFNELINRCMIQPVNIQYDGTALGCRVHDMVLELIISLSIKANFVTVLDQQGRKFVPGHKRKRKIQEKIRRVSHQSQDVEKSIYQMCLSHVRSFNPFGFVKEVPRLEDFQALRVLDLSSCKSVENHHIANIGVLFQLKYLDLYRTNVSELPEEIGNLKYLETLDLRGCQVSRLPATIVRLEQLQRLLVDEGVTLPDDIGRMQALEMLLSPSMSYNSLKLVNELGELIQMRKLGIIFGKPAGMVDEVRMYTDCFVSSLNKLDNLQSLKINSEEGSPLDSLIQVHLYLRGLKKLMIGYISRLPKWIPFLERLEHLEVEVPTVRRKGLRMLKDISTLIYLKLKLKHAPKENLVVGNTGFRCLQEFHFICWNDGMGLVFAEDAMPRLRTLHLSLGAREAISKYGGVDSRIEHLSGLENLHAEVDCRDSTKEEVEAMEASIKRVADAHPNRLTLEIHRRSEAMVRENHKAMDEDKKDVPNRTMSRKQNKRTTRVQVAFRVRPARRKWKITLRNRHSTINRNSM